MVENVNTDWLLHSSAFSEVLHAHKALTSNPKEFLHHFRIKMTILH